MINKWVVQAWTCWLDLFAWWSKHHQTVFTALGQIETTEHTRLCGTCAVRQISSDLDNLACKFDSDSTLFCFVSFLWRSLGWLVPPPLTPDLLIPYQLQRGLQGGLCDCVHACVSVTERRETGHATVSVRQYVPVFFGKCVDWWASDPFSVSLKDRVG